jgi:hypothetical protein
MADADDANQKADAYMALAQGAYESAHNDYEAAEAKATRYLTVLALAVGAAALKAEDLISTLRNTAVTWRWECPFCLAETA